MLWIETLQVEDKIWHSKLEQFLNASLVFHLSLCVSSFDRDIFTLVAFYSQNAVVMETREQKIQSLTWRERLLNMWRNYLGHHAVQWGSSLVNVSFRSKLPLDEQACLVIVFLFKFLFSSVCTHSFRLHFKTLLQRQMIKTMQLAKIKSET